MSTATKLSVAGGATVLLFSAGLVASAAVATGDVRSAAPVTAIPAGPAVAGRPQPWLRPPRWRLRRPRSCAASAARLSHPRLRLPCRRRRAVPPAPEAVAAAPTPAKTPIVLPAAPPPADPSSLPSLTWGDSGSAVQTLQVRLNALGFRTPTSEGDFDDGTWSAVLAFQKFEGLERTGDVTPEVWQHLYQPQGWLPPSQPATVPKVEVDLDRQVLFLLNLERPGQVVILNTSTGGGYSYTTKDGSTGYAFTPEGDFSVYRTYDGTEMAPLGTLYRPMYFHGGWAMHGSPSVPAYPASHGCVRLSNDDMDWVWDRAPSDLAVTVRATMDPASLAEDGQEAASE